MRGDDRFEIHLACQIPANMLLMDRLAEVFDGFTLDVPALTVLVLGQEPGGAPGPRDPAVRRLVGAALAAAHVAGRRVTVCDPSPGDDPALLQLLVDLGVDHLSVDADALVATNRLLLAAESGRR